MRPQRELTTSLPPQGSAKLRCHPPRSQKPGSPFVSPTNHELPAGINEPMNPIETNDQGEYLCHWCKQPVPYAALGIRVILVNGQALRIGTCSAHWDTEPANVAP